MLKINTLNSNNRSKAGAGAPAASANGANDKNRGGLLGGVGYTLGNIGLGVGGVVEGISDLVLAGGALLLGDTDYAEWVFKDNTVGEWRESLIEAYNPDEVMSFVGDVGHGVGQSSVLLLNAIPGAGWVGTAAFMSGISSQGISSAAAKTGEVGLKEVSYGALSGAVEGGLEVALGGAGKAAKALVKGGLKNVTKTAIRKGLGKQVLSSAASEFGEEFLSEYIDAGLQRITQVDPNAEVSLKDAIYAGAVGAVSGGLTTGVVGVSQNAHNAKRGARIIENGNADNVVNTAKLVADRLAGSGVDFEKAADWITALRGQVDAYNALSPDQKLDFRGKTILGEMQASLYFAETQANVALVEKKIKNKSLADKEALAAYVSNLAGKKYTAADIDADTDHITGELAILDYSMGILNIDAAMAEDAAIENKIAVEQGKGVPQVAMVQDAEGAIPSGTVENGVSHSPVHPAPAGAVQSATGQVEVTADTKYSIARTQNMSWSDQLKNTKRSDTLVVEKNTPSYLTEKGVVDLPLAIPKSVITKAQSGKDESHSISDANIKNLQKGIQNAIAVVDDKARKSIIVVTNLKENGKPIIVSFLKDSLFDGDRVHQSTSIHARQNLEAYLSKYNANDIQIINKNEFDTLSRKSTHNDARVQESDKLADNRISQNDDVVNTQTQNNSDQKDLAEKGARIAQERAEEPERADVSKSQEKSADAKNEAENADKMQSAVGDGAHDVPNSAQGAASTSVDAESEADVAERRARAEERARKWAEWEENTKPTAQELNTAREYVKGFDSLENNRRLAIIRMIRSAEGKVDEKTLRGVANLMAMRSKNGQAIAPDLEFRFAEGISDLGLRTHIGDKTLILINSDSEYNSTMRGTIAHELVHYIENKAGYDALAKYVLSIAKRESIAEIEAEYIADYEARNQTYTQADLDKEVVAKLVGKALNSEKFLARYAQKDDKLIRRVGRFLKGIVSAQREDAELSEVATKMMAMFDKALGQESVSESGGDKRSIAGKKAKTADRIKLATAQDMIANGADSEAVRKETGWFKGYDGKWRFEIDDSEMKVSVPDGKYLKVGDMVDHPKLFEAYPELKDIYVTFLDLEEKQGSYSRVFGDIELSRDLLSSPDGLKSVIAHELQHAIQDIEGFARGASAEYWEKRLVEGYDSRQAYVKAEEKALLDRIKAMRLDDANNDTFFVSDMEDLEKMRPDHPRGKIDWDTLEQIEEDSPQWKSFDRQRDQLSEVYGEARVFNYLKISSRLEQIKHLGERFAHDLYFQTAGEVEARDVQKRLHLDETQRKNTRPDIDQEDVVFAEGVSYYQAGSIDEDEDAKSIRQQLNKSKDKLAEITPIKSKYPPQKFKNAKETLEWAVNALKSSGELIQREGYGDVVLDKKRLKNGLSYLKTDAEKVAFSLIPKVIKNGIEIGRHPKHKGRNYDTVTFALPVIIGNTTGYMAVVIREEGKKYYKLHRVFMPDGGLFDFTETKKSNAETAGLQNANVSPTNVASNSSIPQKSDLSTQNDKKDLKPKKKKVEAGEKPAKNTEQKTDDSAPDHGKIYTKKTLVEAIETVLKEFKSEIFGGRLITISKSRVAKLVDDYR